MNPILSLKLADLSIRHGDEASSQRLLVAYAEDRWSGFPVSTDGVNEQYANADEYHTALVNHWGLAFRGPMVQFATYEQWLEACDCDASELPYERWLETCGEGPLVLSWGACRTIEARFSALPTNVV